MRIVLRILLDLVGIVVLSALGVFVLAKSYWVAQLTNTATNTYAWVHLEDFLGLEGVDDEDYLIFVIYLVVSLIVSFLMVAVLHRGFARLRGTNQQ